MKKLIIICALVMILGLIGCANDEPTEQGPAYEPTETPAPEFPVLNDERKVELGRNFIIQFPELYLVEHWEYWGVSPYDLWDILSKDSEEWSLLPQEVREYFGHVNSLAPRVDGYFGTFNEREVVLIEPWSFDQAHMMEEIAGYTFRFPTMGWYVGRDGWGAPGWDGWGGVHLWLHDDGEFMCICVGYERGYLTAEDIGVIWERYMSEDAIESLRERGLLPEGFQ